MSTHAAHEPLRNKTHDRDRLSVVGREFTKKHGPRNSIALRRD
ncbi:hypothetical protein UXJ21_00205 [Burkholderia multivorans]|nr:hypothetical protein [Burkholderia multivorans]